MKLTPLDIHHKEFRRSVRGYSESEVDRFLDDVADELERLFKENIDLSEKLESAEERVRSYEDMERTLHNTMLAAQKSAEDIVQKAQEEANTLLRDAEVKAKEIIHEALTQKQRIGGELLRIKRAEEDFRARFREMLGAYEGQLTEIPLPSDVQILFAETTEGPIGGVVVSEEAGPVGAEGGEVLSAESAVEAGDLFEIPESAEVAEAIPSAEVADSPVLEEAGAGEEQSDVRAADEGSQPQQALYEVLTPTEGDAAESGFVSSVQLGELDAPELAEEEPIYEEPREFDSSAFADLGERDDDVDIEEIE